MSIRLKHILCIVVILLFAEISFSQSIIVKFRSQNSLLAPSTQLKQVIDAVSTRDILSAERFTKRTSPQQIQSVKTDFGLDRIILLPLKSSVAKEDAIQRLTSLDEIEYAEPNYIYHIDAGKPNDSLYSEQWSHANMHVAEAWQITKGDTSIKIGFVDTGVEWDHPDLVGQFAVNAAEDRNRNGLFDAWSSTVKGNDARGNPTFGDLDGIDEDGNGYVDDVIGYDFVDQEVQNFGDASVRDPIPQDENKHGTTVAGVIGAKENNRIGVAGIAPRCRLVALRAFDATGNAEDDDIASAIVYAADNNVRIVNLSFGEIIPSLLQRDAIRYAVSKGTLVFASSGNIGGDRRHYPSDFDECVSVGGSAINDGYYTFTTHGEGMDLIAPGNDILTTTLDGKYLSASGTSYSSPTAAAVAALVWSKNPKLSALEVRSILISTTKDFSPNGYDHQHANGRVDALAAVKYVGSASIKITSPHTNDGFHPGDSIHVTGSAASSLFTGYSMSYAKGLNPDRDSNSENFWTSIANSTRQIISGSLGNWNTSGLAPDTYTLRLAVTSSDKRTTEERITIEIKNSVPKILSYKVDTLFINDKRGLLIQATADTLTTATLYYRTSGSTTLSAKQDDRLTKGHAIVLSTDEAPMGATLAMQLVLRNTAGDSTSVSFSGAIPNEAISERGFNRKSYTLPLGFLLDTVIATPKGDHVVMSVFPPGSDFGPIRDYSFSGSKFTLVDSLARSWVPRGIGNTSGDGKPELLLQGGSNYILYKQNTTHTLLGDIIAQDSIHGSYFMVGLGDIDGDEKDEVLTKEAVKKNGRIVDELQLRRRNGSAFDVVSTLDNSTAPAAEYQDNRYSKPDVRFADNDGDGKNDVILIDDDADLLVYKYDASVPGKTKLIYKNENDGYAEGNLVTTGDFNGDGKADIAFAYHTQYDENGLHELSYRYWTLKILFGKGDGSFTQALSEHFANARSEKPYRSSMSAMRNVSGAGFDELALSFFPNFYLYSFDASSLKMKPIWHFPVSIAPRTGLAYDFDRNGKREFALNAEDSIYFFERDNDYTERPAAPGGLEALPRDTNRVDLAWAAVSGAKRYLILRAAGTQYDVIDSTSATNYSDMTVSNAENFIYSVVTVDETKPLRESLPAYGVEAFVHSMPLILSVSSDKEEITLHTSQPLAQKKLVGNIFLVDDSIETSSVIISADSTLIATMVSLIQAGIHNLRLRSFSLRDKWNSPFDTSRVVLWTSKADTEIKQFYIVRWRFESYKKIFVEFNARPADNALDVTKYSLTPYGRLISVERDGSNPNALNIILDGTLDFVALGKPFILCVHDITSIDNIPIDETEGNCAGVTLTESNLENVMVYPNPALEADEKVTFARLTDQAEISIYSQNLRFLRRLRTIEHGGGVEWDLRDETGNILPSGVYIYHVTGKNDNGDDVAPKESKFVLVRNK